MESQNVFNKEGNGAQRRPAAKFRTGPAAMFGRRLVGTGAVTFPYRVRFDAVVSGKLLADDTPERVFTEPLLSRAYAADIAVSRNPLNNNLEITTRVDEASKEKDAALLKKICCE